MNFWVSYGSAWAGQKIHTSSCTFGEWGSKPSYGRNLPFAEIPQMDPLNVPIDDCKKCKGSGERPAGRKI